MDFGSEIPFPPLYKMFCNLFILGPIGLKTNDYIDNYGLVNSLGAIKFTYLDKTEDQFDLMEYFFKIEDILFDWNNNGTELEEQWAEHNLHRTPLI